MGKKVNFLVISALAIIALLFSKEYKVEGDLELLDSGDTSWMLVASAFVLLMTPGLAFFYGGMVNKRNIISTMLQSFVALGVVSILWVIFGFSLAFGESIGVLILKMLA
jgi:ammonium transporter, Amt family